VGVVRIAARFPTAVADVWSAITDPDRLVRWYGTVEGDLRLGGEITALATVSQSDLRGRIDVCTPPQTLSITTWNEEGREHTVTAELTAEGAGTALVLETRGMPVDIAWAYGAGWHVHVEDLAAHLAGTESPDWPASSNDLWSTLEPTYQAMSVTPLGG
jgi:uncharacterized protein YndB with AHSA1/START domain